MSSGAMTDAPDVVAKIRLFCDANMTSSLCASYASPLPNATLHVDRATEAVAEYSKPRGAWKVLYTQIKVLKK